MEHTVRHGSERALIMDQGCEPEEALIILPMPHQTLISSSENAPG